MLVRGDFQPVLGNQHRGHRDSPTAGGGWFRVRPRAKNKIGRKVYTEATGKIQIKARRLDTSAVSALLPWFVHPVIRQQNVLAPRERHRSL